MARAPRVTYAYLRAYLASGAGTGYGEQYQPFLQIKRWNPSPKSTQVLGAIPPYRRQGHFFSQSEWHLALTYSWAGCLLREQYPLWPWAHPHPMSGDPDTGGAQFPWSQGHIEVCREAAIRHGVFPGTSIPYIWTIDLNLTMPWVEDPHRRCCFVSVKPIDSEEFVTVDPLMRSVEKLEAERRYAKSMGIRYFVGSSSLYAGRLLENLIRLHKAALLPNDHALWPVLQRFLDRHADKLYEDALESLGHRLCIEYSITWSDAVFLLNHCLWNQLIDCDLSRRLDLESPALPGGLPLKAAIRCALAEGGIQ